MILYIFFLVVAFVAWVIATGIWTTEAFDDHKRGRSNPQKVKRARLAWLSFFLLPVYPIVVIVVAVVGPITVFRRLGRINKEETQ